MAMAQLVQRMSTYLPDNFALTSLHDLKSNSPGRCAIDKRYSRFVVYLLLIVQQFVLGPVGVAVDEYDGDAAHVRPVRHARRRVGDFEGDCVLDSC